MRREERKAKVFPSAVNEQKMTCLSPLGVSKGSRQSILRARLEAHTGNHSGFSSLHRHEAACHGTSTMVNLCTGHGCEQLNVPMGAYVSGLGGSLDAGLSKATPLQAPLWNISGNSIQVPIHVVSSQIP